MTEPFTEPDDDRFVTPARVIATRPAVTHVRIAAWDLRRTLPVPTAAITAAIGRPPIAGEALLCRAAFYAADAAAVSPIEWRAPVDLGRADSDRPGAAPDTASRLNLGTIVADHYMATTDPNCADGIMLWPAAERTAAIARILDQHVLYLLAEVTVLRGRLDAECDIDAERDRLAAALDQVHAVAAELAAEGDLAEVGSDEYVTLHTAAARVRAAAGGETPNAPTAAAASALRVAAGDIEALPEDHELDPGRGESAKRLRATADDFDSDVGDLMRVLEQARADATPTAVDATPTAVDAARDAHDQEGHDTAGPHHDHTTDPW